MVSTNPDGIDELAVPLDLLLTSPVFGMADRIGSIEAGKFADLIAVPGNPLDDIGALELASFVMKGGAVVHRR